jgi:hypothetical protein
MKTRRSLAFVALFVTLSCSGRPDPATDEKPLTSGVTGSSLVRAMDEGTPPTGEPAVCPIGKGDPDAHCDEAGPPELLADVNAAIDELIARRPELFDLERKVGQDGYLVRDPAGFYQGVAAILQAKGLCAEWDFIALQVKNGQARSERYDLLLSNDHIRRGAGSFRATCSPASFPLDPAQVIHRVRVAFYSIQCDDGRTPPRNGEGLLPVDCTGFVTATPKKKDETDVDKRVHGPEIVWELEQAGEPVSLEDFPRVDFNKLVRGRDPGEFRLCATVQTHKGCLNGTVVQDWTAPAE